MRLWIALFVMALAGVLTASAAASHTTKTSIEIDMGETFDLLRGAGELVEVVARPPGILAIRPAGKLKVEVECDRVGDTVVTIRYAAGGGVHTLIVAVKCVQKER
ncbi:MAG: hypothetical protein ACRDFT_01065 [bacterium]